VRPIAPRRERARERRGDVAPNAIERVARQEAAEDREAGASERQPSSFTSPTTACTDSFASPNSSAVFSL
jgi:hypothetical protein